MKLNSVDMDWINSALDESEEDEEKNDSKSNLEHKDKDKSPVPGQEASPFPKVVKSTETVKKTSKKGTNQDNNDLKELNRSKIDENEGETSDKPCNLKTAITEKDVSDQNKEKSLSDVSKADKNDSNKSKNLFSIETKTRKTEKFDEVRIKSQELTESDLKELSQHKSSKPHLRSSLSSKSNLPTQSPQDFSTEHSGEDRPGSQPKSGYEETLDYEEALATFNKSNVNFDKLLKSNQWLGPKVKIKDINAENLLLSQQERDRNYTSNKELLYEGAKRFTMPTRLMETDDGQVITTNVARRTQKRKHQINWLAMEAQDKEMEIMEQTAHMRKSKRETQMKYGW